MAGMEIKPNEALENSAGKGKPSGPPGFMRDDYPIIRRAVLALGSSFLAACVLVGITSNILSSQQERRQLAQQQRDAARNKLAETENEKREILNFQPKFVQLRARNIVGDEKRLDWIDAVRKIQDQRNFLPISYEIFAQQNFTLDPNLPMANLELRGSKMGLTMKLLHEMDLFHFLNDLRKQGFYAPLSCRITRIGPTQENPQPTGMAADCSLLWITMKEKAATPQ